MTTKKTKTTRTRKHRCSPAVPPITEAELRNFFDKANALLSEQQNVKVLRRKPLPAAERAKRDQVRFESTCDLLWQQLISTRSIPAADAIIRAYIKRFAATREQKAYAARFSGK